MGLGGGVPFQGKGHPWASLPELGFRTPGPTVLTERPEGGPAVVPWDPGRAQSQPRAVLLPPRGMKTGAGLLLQAGFQDCTFFSRSSTSDDLTRQS